MYAYSGAWLVLGAVLNIFGDAFFMRVLHMGIAGAGLSTALSQYVSTAVLLSMFFTGKVQSRFAPKYISLRAPYVGSIFVVGFPSLIRQGLGSVSTMVLNGQAAVYGDAAIAAMSIVSRISNFLFAVGLGIGQGFQPVSAFNYGAKNYSRVRQGFAFTMKFCACTLSAFAVLGFVFAPQLVTLFRDDPEVIRIAVFAMRVRCASLPFLALSTGGNMLLQSVGKGWQASFLSCLRSGLCFIPVLLLFSALFGLTGIQIAESVSDLLAGLITLPFIFGFFRLLPPDGMDAV